MSSFDRPHKFFLFDMKNGKKKLTYGHTPDDALEILALRLTEAEMNEVIRDKYIMISHQRDIQKYIDVLG